MARDTDRGRCGANAKSILEMIIPTREREREREREDAIGNVRCENDARVRESGREVAIFGSHRWDERSIRPAAEKDETNDAGAPPRSP
jgi:hypothetical protein